MRIFRNSELNNSENKVSGYCIVFEKESVNLGGFTEIIHRGAITQETLDNSDIFATLDHKTDYVLARSKYGKGNLLLTVDDKGVYFEFELPDTFKGDEVRSYIKRGELNQCSFCFSLDVNDKSSEKWSVRNNLQYREIFKIDKLYDISLVFQPAYEQTEVSLRNALQEEKEYNESQINILKESRDMTPEEKQEQENDLKQIETLKSEVKELKEELLETEMEQLEEKLEEKSEIVEEKQEEKQDENEEEKEQISEENSEKQQKDDVSEDKEQEDSEKEDKQINNKNKRHIYMKTETFLLKEIRNAAQAGGKQTFKFPALNEYRTVTVNDQGEAPNVVAGVHDNIVETELTGILSPLYADSILFNLGCRTYKGLPMGDISIPKMSKTSVGWASEIAAATATGVAFENVVLSPKRITSYIDISKMLLAQDSLNSEAEIRRDIVNALNSKLQQTFFSDDAGTNDKPAGIFYNETLTEVENFADLADLEATIDDANVKGERKYVGSNKAKAAFRVMPKSALTNELMMNAGEIDGTPFIATSDIEDKNFCYGNFADGVAIASWGDVELTVDPYTTAINGCVRLIINAYFDWVKVRPEALAYGKIKED